MAAAEKFHLLEECGIAGKIERTVLVRDDETACRAAIGAIGKNGRVPGGNQLHAAEGQIDAASQIQADAVLNSFFLEPGNDLVIAYDYCVGVFGDFLGITDMIAVTVAQ